MNTSTTEQLMAHKAVEYVKDIVRLDGGFHFTNMDIETEIGAVLGFYGICADDFGSNVLMEIKHDLHRMADQDEEREMTAMFGEYGEGVSA